MELTDETEFSERKGRLDKRATTKFAVKKKRRCLKCDRSFMSINRGNRLCMDCCYDNQRVSRKCEYADMMDYGQRVL